MPVHMAMTYDDVNISDFCFAQITKAVVFSFDDSNHLLVRLSSMVSLLIINERMLCWNIFILSEIRNVETKIGSDF